jgi:hypothetical protein
MLWGAVHRGNAEFLEVELSVVGGSDGGCLSHIGTSSLVAGLCKPALLHIKVVMPKGSVTEKLYSQSLCSIYIHLWEM